MYYAAYFGFKFDVLQVRVVEIPGVSMELCGGTHVNNTSEICGFKIISEQGIASGIRRIEAVAGEAFIENINARDFYLKQLCSTLKVCSMILALDFSKPCQNFEKFTVRPRENQLVFIFICIDRNFKITLFG